MSFLDGSRVTPGTEKCWACIDGEQAARRYCYACGAPPWKETKGPNGVYIVQAVEAGMLKIGISRSVPMRVARFGKRVKLVTVLWGADRYVEAWLHRMFSETRDPRAALDWDLPAFTEWFWPTPALKRLADDREFLRHGCLWEDPR